MHAGSLAQIGLIFIRIGLNRTEKSESARKMLLVSGAVFLVAFFLGAERPLLSKGAIVENHNAIIGSASPVLSGEYTLVYTEIDTDLRSLKRREQDRQQVRDSYQRAVKAGEISKSNADEMVRDAESSQARISSVTKKIVSLSQYSAKFIYIASTVSGESPRLSKNHRILCDGKEIIDYYSSARGATTNVFSPLAYGVLSECPLPGIGIVGMPLWKSAGIPTAVDSNHAVIRAEVPVGSSGGSGQTMVYAPANIYIHLSGSTPQVTAIQVKAKSAMAQDTEFPSYTMLGSVPIASKIIITKYDVDTYDPRTIAKNIDINNLKTVPIRRTEYHLISATRNSLDPSSFK